MTVWVSMLGPMGYLAVIFAEESVSQTENPTSRENVRQVSPVGPNSLDSSSTHPCGHFDTQMTPGTRSIKKLEQFQFSTPWCPSSPKIFISCLRFRLGATYRHANLQLIACSHLLYWQRKTRHLKRPEQPLVLGSATWREPTVFGSALRLGPHTLDRHTKFTFF